MTMKYRRCRRRPGEVSLKKSLGHGVGWSASCVNQRRQPRQVSQRTRAPWAVGWFSMGRSARGSRATGIKRDTTTYRSRSRRPGAVSAKRSLGQRSGLKRVPRKPAMTTTPRPPARACFVGGWPVLYEAKRARAVRYESQRQWELRFEAAAADLARCWRQRALANGVGWSASRVGREDNYAKSARARLHCGQLAVLFMGRSARGSHAMDVKRGNTTMRSRSRRPGTVSAKKSLGQRRGVERVVRWPRRQPHQLFQRGRAPSAVGPFSTGRSARGLRGTGVNATAMTFRSCARPPGAVSVKKILGQ